MDSTNAPRPIRENGRVLTAGHWLYPVLGFVAAVSNCVMGITYMCVPPRRINTLITLNEHDIPSSDSDPLYE